MLNAKYALEREVASPMPSPPLRVPTGEGASGTVAAAAAVGEGAGGEGVADTPDEVTETLHRLADLRDRGAISAAEYEAKKAELLGRL